MADLTAIATPILPAFHALLHGVATILTAVSTLVLAIFASVLARVASLFDPLAPLLLALLDVLATRLARFLDPLPHPLDARSRTRSRDFSVAALPPLRATLEQLLDHELPFLRVDASIAVLVGAATHLRGSLRVLGLEPLPPLLHGLDDALTHLLTDVLSPLLALLLPIRPALLAGILPIGSTYLPAVLSIRSTFLPGVLPIRSSLLTHFLACFDARSLRLLRRLRQGRC